MKLAVALCALAIPCVATAQDFTHCSRMAGFVNCNTTGDHPSSTNCNQMAGFTNCTTNRFYDGAPNDSSGSNENGAAAAAGVVVVGAGLALLIAKIKSDHDKKVKIDRATRVKALIDQHDCVGAAALATKEHDFDMASKVGPICKTLAQVGEQPTYSAPDMDSRIAWMKTTIRFPPTGQLVGLNATEVAWAQTRGPAPGTVWVHTEALGPEGEKVMGARSTLTLETFDCATARMQITAVSMYAGNNSSGELRTSDSPSQPYVVRPGSFGEGAMKIACASPTPTATPVSVTDSPH